MPDLYQALLLAPALAYDLVRLGRIHRTYVIGLALLLATSLVTHYLSGAAWWLAIGREVLRPSP